MNKNDRFANDRRATDAPVQAVARRIINRKRIKRLISLLCAIVMFMTVNGLRLDAHTLEHIPTCGYEEHTHSDACYDENMQPVCGLDEHVHTDACYQEPPQSKDEDVDGAGDADEPEAIDIAPVDAAYSEADEQFLGEDGDAAFDADVFDTSAPEQTESLAEPAPQEVPQTPSFSFADRDYMLASEIAPAAGLDLGQVVDVAAVENDESQAGCLGIERLDGDWLIYAAREFDEAELAFFIGDAIETVKLTDGAPLTAQESTEAGAAEADSGLEADDDAGETSDPAVGSEPEAVVEEGQGVVDANAAETDENAIGDDASGAGDGEASVEMPAAEADMPAGEDADAQGDVDADAQDDVDAAGEGEQTKVADPETDEVKEDTGADAADPDDAETDNTEADDADPDNADPDDAETDNTEADDADPDDADPNDAETDNAGADDADPNDADPDDAETDNAGADDADPDDADSDDTETDNTEADDAETKEGDDQNEAADDAEADETKSDSAEDDETKSDDTAADDGEADDAETDDAETDDAKADDGEADDAEADDAETADDTEAADDAEADGSEPDEGEAPSGAYAGGEARRLTVDLAEAKYPVSLRALFESLSAAPEAETEPEDAETPAQAEDAPEADEGASEAADEGASGADEQASDGDAAEDVAITAVDAVVVEDETALGDGAPEIDANALLALPVNYDASLLHIEATEDDKLITPIAAFEETEIAVGGIYTIALLNGAAPEAPAAMPAQSFEGATDYILVKVEAGEGAFPEGTTMSLEDVLDEGTLSDIGDAAVTEDFVEVKRVHAVDITFKDADGREIEPLIPISVVMSMREAALDGDAQGEAAPEENTVVVHVDNDGNVAVVESADAVGAVATDDAEAPAATGDAVGDVVGDAAAAAEGVGFMADAFSVYGLVVTQRIETRFITALGETYDITVTYGPEALIPGSASLSVREIEGDEAQDYLQRTEETLDSAQKITMARFFDIKIMDGEEEVHPAAPVVVTATLAKDDANTPADGTPVPCAVHFDGEQPDLVNATEADEAVTFRAEGFSVWGVVYTVDLEYEVNGKVFTSSMPGAEDISLDEIVKGLSIVDEAELETFLSKIASVISTNEEVAVVTEDRSVRVLKDGDAQIVITMQDGAKFEIDVSADGETEISDENNVATVSTVNDLYLPANSEVKAELLTEEQSENAIAAVQTTAESDESSAATYQAFSIALENVDVSAYDGFKVAVTLPEDTVVGRDFQLYQVREDGSATDLTESLTVTSEQNEDGLQKVSGISFTTEDFADFVLSYSIETYYTTADGDRYKITLNYGPKAEIPDGAELKVREILPEDETYGNYLDDSAAKLGVNSGDVTFARFFDIEIQKDDEKIEPKAPVQVTISLADTPEETLPEGLKVVHFAETGLETIDETQAEQKKDATIELSFETDGFSVYGVVYTVDFQYEEYTYSIRGGNSILLSDMVKELHISDNDAAFMSRVKNVEFTDPALMRVTYINNPTTVAAVEEYIFDGVFDDAEKEPGSNRKLDEGEWLLTSLAPFKTEEALTITLDSGRQIVITVLDGQEVAGNTFITDAHLTIDGTTYGKDEPWTVYPDVGYTMKLSFAEKGQNQFPAGGDTIVVDLPQGLTIPEGEHHTFTIPAGLAGSITGNEYWVENGKIYVKFGEDPDDILTRSSNAHFDLIFTAKFEEGTTQIPFNDKVKPNIDMDTTADVSVSKSASYNSATGKMDYTITVKSTGNSEDVKVHDALANTNLLKIDTGSITVSPGGTEYTVTNSSQSGFDMTIPSIGHNQTVTITYSADVDTSALDHKGNIKVSEDGKNTVTVENDDDDHDEDTNTYTNQIKYSSTSKSSTSMEDHEEEQTATLGWKIVLNDNYRGSIVGDKVWDTIDWSSKDAMKYTVDENGNVSLHIAAKNQDGTKTYDTTVTAAVVTDPNGIQSWEYTIPQLGADPDEILSYEITYTTEVDKTKLDSSSNGIVKNNTTNEGDGSSTGTGVVPIPHSDEPGEDDIVGGKTAVNVTEEYVDWDIVINVPAEGFPDGLTVKDYVPMAPQYGGFADTFDSILSVTGLVGGETYTYDCVSTDEDDNGNVIWDLRNNNRMRDVVTIEFYQDAQKTTKGLGETEHARTLTIRIRTKNDPEWLAYIEREGSGDSYVYYHTNIAKANNTTFEGKAAPQKSKIYKTLIASDEKAPDGMPVYRYAVDLAGVKKLPIVIEDTFNADELEYYAYWYETDNHQYIDGQSQRHNLNNGISPYKASIVAENGKITITATDLPKKDNGDFWEYYRIYYKLKIKNQAVLDSFTQKAIENGGVYYVRNTAAWNGTDDHVDIEFKVPTVEKTGAFRINQGESGNNRLYDFAIDINKECLELNAGEPMDLTDTHTDNLTVDYTTVKVYKYVDGEKTPDTSIQWNFNGNIGTFYDLQDCTHYVIEYSCLVIGSATQSFSNYAEMNGYHSEKHDSRDFGTTVEAGADVFQIGLIKFKNGMTSQGLAGATFQLFRGTGSFHEVTNGTDTWMEEDRIPMTWGVGTETAGKVGQNITFTTGEDGYVLIALDQTKHGSELEKGVHYFLKEIESPPGYQIDSSVEYWEFTLTMDPDEVSHGTERDQYGNRLWIYFYYDDILKMNNTETDEPITVNVDKEWFDIEGNKIENPEGLTAEVQLYQKKNNEDYAAVDTITNADGTIYNGKITLPADGSWEYSWENLPRVDTDGNGYAYKLEEVEVPEDYVSSYTLNETENEKNYHLKNYRVTERKVNVSVSKTWLDEDGKTEIDINDLPEDLQEVQFYLYRVISRAPFTAAPTSGGNPYTIEGNQYLVTGPDAEDGLYKITREQFQAGISFEELPSVHKDDDGTWYFYSYYVKEVPVDGYSASVDVTETQDEQNNTILLSSMKNKKKPEERTTNFSVQKVWKDKEGGDKSWPDNTVVRFKLYQVTGTTPFDEQPTSGGVLYNVAQVNYNDHPNKVSGEDGLYQIGHTYQGSVLETAEFENLPEVTIDASGRATYYAYYVDEIEVSGYETSYSYVDEDGTVKVTITNRQEPEYTQLSVQKTWYDGDNEITDANVLEKLSATVELVRYRSVPSGTTVHFTMYKSAEDLASVLVPRNQTGVNITINSITGGANAKFTQAFTPTDEFYKVSGEWWGWIQGATTKTITTPDASDVYVVFGDGTVSSIDVSTTSAVSGGAAALDPTFDSAPYQIELNREHNFAYTYTKLLTAGVGSDDGQTYVYTYGVREVSNPSGFIFDSYSVGSNAEDGSDIPASNPGTAGTAIIVKNIKNELLGSLKLTKEVTVNGHDTTTNLADGAYVFSIAGPDSETIVKHVQITVTNGKAVSYKVADGPYAPDWTSVEDAVTFASDAVNREAVVSDLAVGDYTITETEVSGMTTTVSGGKESKDNDEARSITVTVTPGETVEAKAKATFNNDTTPMASFNFNKVWLDPTGNVATPTSYRDWQENITVTIKRKAGASGDDEYFALKYTISKNGDTFTATMDPTASKIPKGEGPLTDLTLTGSSTDNVFNFNLPEESLRKYNDDGTEWVYYVVEDEVPLYVTSYGVATTGDSGTTYSETPGASDAKDGGVIVNQTFGGYELPSTGGMGTNLLYLIGSMLIMLASAGFILLQRKKRVE